LPIVKTYEVGAVHYAGDVVVREGSTYQALCDTARAPPHPDHWICLASAGRDAITPTVRGTFDAKKRYEKLEVVTFDKSSFIARHDDPGLCPGDGWQLLAAHGTRGEKGLPGSRGEKGDKGARLASRVNRPLLLRNGALIVNAIAPFRSCRMET
jgi:hypothetical protein